MSSYRRRRTVKGGWTYKPLRRTRYTSSRRQASPKLFGVFRLNWLFGRNRHYRKV